jgi:hypothetical protein
MRATTGVIAAALSLALLACGSNSSGQGGFGGSVGTGGGSGGRPGTGGALGSGGAGLGGAGPSGGSAAGGEKGTGGASGGAGGAGAQGGGKGGSTTGAAGAGGNGAGGVTGGGLGGGAGASAGAGGSAGADAAAGQGGGAGGGGAAGGGGSTAVSHRFLKSGCNSQSVAIVAADGHVEWEYPIADETGDSWLLPNGNVIFSFSKGVREVTPAKATVWEYLAPSGAETHSCQPLADELFLVGEAHSDGTSFLYEMGRDKKISKTITIKTTGAAHDIFRQVRKTPAGTYLVTFQRTGGQAQEYDGSGKLLRTFPCGRYVGIRLPDDNTLIACGDDHRIIEVDPADKIVWEVNENDIPGNKLLFVAGLQRLPNGNTVVANWSGHVGSVTQPQVFELTRDKKVVWQVKDSKLNLVSSVEILDSDSTVNGAALR